MQSVGSASAGDHAPSRPAAPMSAVRLLARLRWWLPMVLTVLALVVEWAEHLGEDEPISPWFVGELLVFALVGPIAVWFTLTWVARLVEAFADTSDELASMNRQLESMVADRTLHLREATRQLELRNAELAGANAELRQLDTMKSDFVSLVSHQLRAPLTNINGALEIVSADAARLPAESQHTFRILSGECERLSLLIQRILDVTRLEAGRLPVHLGPVALEPLLASAVESTLGVSDDRPRVMRIATGLPPAWADEQLLMEVIRTLLENAARFSPPGSPVAIDARRQGDGLEFGVADEGPGVPAEEQQRIFASFHRVGDADSAIAGHGLGLYFAERLVHAQHGTIGVDSPLRPGTPRPGARFWVRLPVARGGPDEDDESPWLEAAPEHQPEAR